MLNNVNEAAKHRDEIVNGMTQATSQTQFDDKTSSANGIKWRLEDVLPAHSGKIFTTLIEQFESMTVEFESTRNNLDDRLSADRFLQILGEYEKIQRMAARLGSFGYMYFSEDTRSQEGRTFKARTEEINTDVANRILFFELWWKRLDSEKTQELIRSSGAYSYFLERLQKTKPFTLAEEVEQAINLKDSTGKSALLQLYHQIRDSFTYEVKIGAETKRVTEEHLRDLFYSPFREERRAAYEAQLLKFKENTDVLGEIYKALVRDWRNEGIKLRRYSSPISVRNLANDVPDEAVETLLEVCRENAVVFQEFFRIKAKLLSVSDFARYDLYAPFPEREEKKYTWEEAVKMVLDTFRSFNQEFAEMATKVISAKHVNAESREGKLSGAYCMSVTPDIVPYILTSFTGRSRSVSTLAHELGHAIHSQLAAKRSNNQLTFEPSLPLAETASVFGEMIMTDRLMADADENTRQALLLEFIDDAYATIQRQAYFVLFEKEAHEKIASGINVNDLSDTYLRNLNDQFGLALRVPDYFKYEWNVIPHIYQTPFYCYAYAWGNLLVLSLYRQFREEGPASFAPRYMQILSYGGSQSPEMILSDAGFDIRSKSFWQSGFDELSRSVSELRKVI
jgi:oligoendopeptidase F